MHGFLVLLRLDIAQRESGVVPRGHMLSERQRLFEELPHRRLLLDERGLSRRCVFEPVNLHEQTRERERRLQAVPDLPVSECGLVVVAAGAGNRALFESLGAIVVDGGETMNPSTAEILEAVELGGE